MKMADHEVKDAVMTALMQEHMSDIQVDVKRGIVSISGIVDVLDDKKRVEKLVRKIPGVKKVENHLTISTEGEVEDKDIAGAVEAKISRHKELERVGAACHKGIVLLKGYVANIGQERLAIGLAGQVLGVKEVISQLEIEKEARRDDATLTNEVERAFSLEEKLDVQDIQTRVDKGTVYLEGIVDRPAQAVLAEQVAASMPGVSKVVNNIKSTEGSSQDSRLTNRLRGALAQLPHLQEQDLTVHVVAGTAYLSGEVYTPGAKKVAEIMAIGLPGIARVINNIKIVHH